MTNLAVETWLRFLMWLASGLLIYICYGRRHSVLDREHRNARDCVDV